MPEQIPFPDFCSLQIERLGWFGYPYNQLPPGAVAQYAKWLERECAGDRAKASRIIDEACEQERLPTGTELRAIAERLYPRPKISIPVATSDCPHCAGTGYEVIEREGVSGARPCRTGHVASVDDGKPPANEAEENRKRRGSMERVELAGVKR